jgi:hypothetical protein
MTAKVRAEAEKYVKDSLESQKRLGYSSRVEGDVYQSAVSEVARAVARLLKAQRRTRAAA